MAGTRHGADHAGDDESGGDQERGRETGDGVEREADRLNRKLIELLTELRVVIPGVQVLFAFLLIVPFQARAEELTSLQRSAYAVAIVSAALASILLIAPSAYHRLRFRKLAEETERAKREMLNAQRRFSVTGLVCLAVSMTTALFVPLDIVLGTVPGLVVCLGILFVSGWAWFGLPLSRRAGDDDHGFRANRT